MSFLDELVVRARAAHQRIVFPEASDPRVQQAIRRIVAERIAEPVALIDPASPHARDAILALGVETIDPARDVRLDRVAADLFLRRRDRGLSEEGARALAHHPLYFGDDLVLHGEVASCVAGAVHTTADVLRAALTLVGLAPGVRVASSAFYMVLGHDESERVLTFADCAVVPQPTAEQLSDIAVSSAEDRRRIVGDEPLVAFLSYSTLGSAEGESVDRVREAVRLTRARDPQLRVEGELQLDAALVPMVGARKAPGSPVAGYANVLIFPNLDAGNIGYKLTERLAGARAVGPILQGFAKPCADLSRGASPDDITHAAAVTALQAFNRPRTDQRRPE